MNPEEVLSRGKDPDRNRWIKGSNTIVEHCRKDGINQFLYYTAKTGVGAEGLGQLLAVV